MLCSQVDQPGDFLLEIDSSCAHSSSMAPGSPKACFLSPVMTVFWGRLNYCCGHAFSNMHPSSFETNQLLRISSNNSPETFALAFRLHRGGSAVVWGLAGCCDPAALASPPKKVSCALEGCPYSDCLCWQVSCCDPEQLQGLLRARLGAVGHPDFWTWYHLDPSGSIWIHLVDSYGLLIEPLR